MDYMGYQNMQAVFKISQSGRLAKRRGDNMSFQSKWATVLTAMAMSTYDWDSEHNCPPKKLVDKKVPCRYYTMGWRGISDKWGMILLSPEQAMGGKAEEEMEKRTQSIKKNISDACVFLRDQGLIKTLEPATMGRNAGVLLLLGDDAENAAVERWARECLGI